MDSSALKKLSVVIPAQNEEGSVADTLERLHQTLVENQIPHEVVVVDDGSTDQTPEILGCLSGSFNTLVAVRNDGKHGFGRAIRRGFEFVTGDAVVIMMADGSDQAGDVVRYWNKLNEGYDCVFGSRFVRGGIIVDYPVLKYWLNRLANLFIRSMFRIPLNDTTNAFKAYRTEVIRGCEPFLSPHFNITVELPLKAIVRGYTWTVIPISWHNRKAGVSKLKIKEMGSRYLFICLYVWLEKYFSRGDYRRKN